MFVLVLHNDSSWLVYSSHGPQRWEKNLGTIARRGSNGADWWRRVRNRDRENDEGGYLSAKRRFESGRAWEREARASRRDSRQREEE